MLLTPHRIGVLPPADQAHAYAVRLWQGFPAGRNPRPLLYGWSAGVGDPVRITRVEFGTDEFDTDGGPRRLPSWHYFSPMLPGPLVLPAVPRDVLWPWAMVPAPPDQHVYLPLRQATIDPTGTVLTVILLQPKHPCSGQPTYRHDPVVTQTPSVVVVGMSGCSSTLNPPY